MGEINQIKRELDFLKSENKSIKKRLSFLEDINEIERPEEKNPQKKNKESETSVVGIILTILGAILTLTIIGAIIGIPLLIIGIILLVKSSKTKKTKKVKTKEKEAPLIKELKKQPAIKITEPHKKQKDSFELAVGIRWFAWIGILALVIGMGFFVKYAIDNGWINHLTRLVLGAAFGIGLVIFGKIASKNEKYNFWGKVLMGGGIAITYFMAYASYHFEEYRTAIGITLQTNIILLILIVSASIIISLYENSKIIISEAFLLGYMTSLLSGNFELLTLIYTLLLTFSLIAVVSYKRWSLIGIGGLLATYLVYTIWYSSNRLTFIYSSIFLISYFLAFIIQSIILSQDENQKSENIIMILLNSFFFYGLYYVQLEKYYPQITGIFTLIVALLYFIIYYTSTKDEKISSTNLYLSILYLTLAILIQLNKEWITIILSLELLIIGIVSLKSKIKELRIATYALTAIVTIKTLLYDTTLNSLDMNYFLNSTRLIAFSATIISFYVLYYVLNKNSINSEEKSISKIYFYLASFFLLTIMFLELYEYSLLIITLLALISITFATIYEKEKENYLLTSLVISVSLAITLLLKIFNSELNPLNLNNFINSTRFFAFIIIIATSYIIAYIYSTKEETKIFKQIYSSTSLFLIVIMIFLELENKSYLISIILSMIVLILAIVYSTKNPELKIQSIAISAILLIKLVLHDIENLSGFDSFDILKSTRLFAFLFTIISFYIIAYIYKTKEGHSSDNLGIAGIYLWTATVLSVILIFLETSEFLTTIFLAVFALIILVLGFNLNTKTLRLQGIIILFIVILKAFLYDTRNLSTIARTLSFMILGAILLAASFLFAKYKDKIKEVI